MNTCLRIRLSISQIIGVQNANSENPGGQYRPDGIKRPRPRHNPRRSKKRRERIGDK